MTKKIQISHILLICIIALFVSIFIVPMFAGIIISFTDWNGLSNEYSFIGLDNYLQMFQDERFINSLKITVHYWVILLSSSLLLGYISAKAIYKLKRFQTVMLFISFFPYVVTPIIVCILWNQIFIGLIPEIAQILNIEQLTSNLLANKTTALYTVAFVDLWILVPYAMLLFTSALNSIPKEILEHAQVEGANAFQIGAYIESPYILSTIGMLTTIITSYAFTHIDTLMTLTAGGPGRATETIYYTIYKNSTLEQRYAYGLAEGIVVAIFSVLIFLIINKLTNGKHLYSITSTSE